MLTDAKPMKSKLSDKNNVVYQYQTELASPILPGKYAWLTALRQQAATQFATLQFPTRKHEDWKYTSVKKLAQQHFPLSQKSVKLTVEQCQQYNTLSQIDCYLAVFVNGFFDATLSRVDDLPKGVVLSDLPTALAKDNQALRELLLSNCHADKPSQHGFTALNSALMHSGVYLDAPQNSHFTKPIHILHIATDVIHAMHSRNVFILHENSNAQVIEQYCGENGLEYFNNVVTDVVLRPHATLRHSKIINESDQATHIATVRADQQKNSQFDSFSLTLSGGLVRSDTHILLRGEHSHVQLNGLFVTKNKQHVDHHTYIEHDAENTKSGEHYRGILSDSSHGVFNGRVLVNPGAIGTDANQQNSNLLLSREAEIDTKPQLEIFADDVKCTHGATVGQLDQKSLFYCQARGIDLNEAKALLILAFAKQALDEIVDDNLRDHLTDIVLMHLPQ